MTDPFVLMLAQEDGAPSAPGGSGGDGPSAPGQTPKAPDTATKQDPAKKPQEDGGTPGFMESGGIWLIILLMFVVMYVFIFGANRKEKKRRAQMLDSLKKNDKVITIGGIVGTVVEVKPSEVVLKVDESSNTRMKFARTAIQQVVTDEKDSGKND